MKRPRIKHSWLYYRNAAFAWGIAVFTFGFSLATPSNIPVLIIVILFSGCTYLIWTTFLSVHPPRYFAMRDITPEHAGLPYDAVEFKSRDGLNLTGFFVPGPNHRAIILTHGRGDSCNSLIFHAEALHRHGYSVLMLDLRAHGRSAGDTCTFGVLEAQDVLGAVDYLHTRQEIDPCQIGVLGISLGAQAVLRAAQYTHDIRAIAMEGLGPMSLADHGGRPNSFRRWIYYPLNWLVYTLGDFMTGQPTPESTTSLISRIADGTEHHRPILLISAGKGGEKIINQRFYAAASEPKTLWENPNARHAAVFFQKKAEYQEQVNLFFDQHLSVNGESNEH